MSDQVGDVTAAVSAPAGVAQTPGAKQAQVKQLAQEFEALLMTQMLRDMRRSMLSEESPDGYGAGAMSDTADVELGRALSRAGGFGLTSVMLRAIQREAIPEGEPGKPADAAAPRVGPPTSPAAPATPSPSADSAPSPAPAPSSSSASAPVAPQGPVTSPFGWRRDPFTGATRFHSGVDIGMAYGSPVLAAAPGRVVFAGVNGGYGNTIVVEQASGQQMRYAHLSAQNVQVGDAVEAGQAIGQVGSSGRSTGPHLHFERLEGGRAVDPAGSE